MIDLAKEDAILLRDFGKLLPTRPSYSTVWRWCSHGVKNKKRNPPVKLETVLHPAGRATTMEAYRRFLQRLNGATP